jgi:hypothetical protein
MLCICILFQLKCETIPHVLCSSALEKLKSKTRIFLLYTNTRFVRRSLKLTPNPACRSTGNLTNSVGKYLIINCEHTGLNEDKVRQFLISKKPGHLYLCSYGCRNKAHLFQAWTSPGDRNHSHCGHFLQT